VKARRVQIQKPDSLPPSTVQACIAKLNKDINLHEAIQQRYQELLKEGKAKADVIAEEEDSAAETHEEYLELLRQME